MNTLPIAKDQIVVENKRNYGTLEAIAPVSLGTAKVLQDVTSTYLVYFCVFVSEMARGIMLPTLWLFVSSLGGGRFHQGLVVSCFSLGRIIAAPVVGYLSEVYGYKSILTLCNIILAVGAILFSASTNIHQLLFAQFVIGVGAGK
jgi:MFS family permease